VTHRAPETLGHQPSEVSPWIKAQIREAGHGRQRRSEGFSVGEWGGGEPGEGGGGRRAIMPLFSDTISNLFLIRSYSQSQCGYNLDENQFLDICVIQSACNVLMYPAII